MTASQIPLTFTPGLTAQFLCLEDLLAAVVYGSRVGLNGIAAHLDMSPTDLSRRLNRGGEDSRPITVAHLVGIVEATGDKRPIYWQIEKFLTDPEAKRNQAIDQLAAVLPMVIELAAQAGIDTKAKAKR